MCIVFVVVGRLHAFRHAAQPQVPKNHHQYRFEKKGHFEHLFLLKKADGVQAEEIISSKGDRWPHLYNRILVPDRPCWERIDTNNYDSKTKLPRA